MARRPDLLAMTSDEICRQLRLYVIIDPDMTLHNPVDVARWAIDGGATAIQLRAKTLLDRECLGLASAMRAITADAGVLFLINDRIDLALAAEADGVHLGVDDLPVQSARQIAGAGFVIGYSPETDNQAANAKVQGASYLGVGPVFGSASKSDAGPAIGLEKLAHRVHNSSLPVVGIGGISASNARSVLEAGACGVAVLGAILAAPDPSAATRTLIERLEKR